MSFDFDFVSTKFSWKIKKFGKVRKKYFQGFSKKSSPRQNAFGMGAWQMLFKMLPFNITKKYVK
jgi:hypothetical protein